MPRASSSSESSPKKAKASASPRNAKPISPGIQKRRKEWKDSLPALWVKQPAFKHPRGTTTITKTEASKKFHLDGREIGTLPYEQRLSDNGYAMQLYSEDQLMELAMRKCVKLEKPLEIGGLVIHSYSGSRTTGSVSVVSVKNPPALPAWAEHIVNAQPPPLKLADYSSPPDAATPDPDEITWTLDKIAGPVTVQDACRLYCIEPADIQDLATHSPWIDLATVAKRAVTLHGGFYAHKELVLQCRREEEKTLAQEIPEAYKRKSRFRFSSVIREELKHANDDDGMYDGRRTVNHSVAVFYPIEYTCLDDYGCEWEWLPYWGDF